MSNKKKLIPELRFPEFKNEGEWEEIILGELGDVIKGEQLNRIGLTDKGKYPCQNGGINPSGFTDKFNSEENTITISEGGNSCGYVNFMTSKFWLGGHCYKLKTNKKVDKLFLFQTLKHNEEKIMRLRVGSGLPNIQLNAIRNFEFVICNSLSEQKKIASCLSSLDEVIEAHSQKLELLKDHKKGLMQNLFPQEGEKVPKVRFKEFEKDGEWVETTIEKLIQENILFAPKDGNHGNIHPKSSDYVKTGIPFIMASDLKDGKIDFTKCAYLKKEQADLLQKGFAKSGDVLLTHKGTVGEVALLGELIFPYIMLSPQVTYYRVKEKSKMINLYLAVFLSSITFQKNLLIVSGGGTRAYVGITEQQKLGIAFPKNIEEQRKIASCISSLDEVITAQAEKIEQLKQHKNGLMQGLFPKMND